MGSISPPLNKAAIRNGTKIFASFILEKIRGSLPTEATGLCEPFLSPFRSPEVASKGPHRVWGELAGTRREFNKQAATFLPPESLVSTERLLHVLARIYCINAEQPTIYTKEENPERHQVKTYLSLLPGLNGDAEKACETLVEQQLKVIDRKLAERDELLDARRKQHTRINPDGGAFHSR